MDDLPQNAVSATQPGPNPKTDTPITRRTPITNFAFIILVIYSFAIYIPQGVLYFISIRFIPNSILCSSHFHPRICPKRCTILVYLICAMSMFLFFPFFFLSRGPMYSEGATVPYFDFCIHMKKWLADT